MTTPPEDRPYIPTSQPPSADPIYATAPAGGATASADDLESNPWAPTTAAPPYGSTTTTAVPTHWAYDHPDFDYANSPSYYVRSAPPPPAFVQGTQQYSPFTSTAQGAPQEGLDYLSRQDHTNWVQSGGAPHNQQTYAGYLVHGSGLNSTQIGQIAGLSTEERNHIRQQLNPRPTGRQGGRSQGGADRRMHQGPGSGPQGGRRR